MKERRAVKRRRWAPWVLGLFVLVSFTVLVLLQTSNLWKNLSVDTASDTLLLYALSSLNFIAFVIFGFIFLRSIVKLMRERRAFQVGSKIKTKLLVYFAAVSLLPIFAMAGFSYLFMNRALERWFISIPENVIRAPKEIEERSNAEKYARLEETARLLAASMEDRQVTRESLDRLAASGNLALIEVVNKQNGVLENSSLNTDVRSEPEFELIRSGRFDDPALRDGIGVDAAVADLADGRRVVIATNSPSSESVGQIADSALAEFDRMKASNVNVRQIGLLTLGVLTFLLIFASTWTAFYIARGLTVPIKALAEGAEEIAQGNLGHRVDVLAEDELALLVSSFNEMSARLEANSAELTERRRYIETVLLSLPTGVISVDSENRVGTINPAARAILKLEHGDFTGTDLGLLVGDGDRETFERLVARAKRIGHSADQTKIRPEYGNGEMNDGMPVAITATALPENSGAVIVIEDLSELIAAQRAAAWQEVARRMAHEIKNPLTPIQLSAERIAKRFKSVPSALAGGSALPLEKLSLNLRDSVTDDPNAKVILDGTETILREVQSLKAMVDEFSRFARLPEVRLEPGDVNEIIRQAADLYRDRANEVVIDLKLADELPGAMVDEEQLRRVFGNLIDNAIEAPGGDDADRIVTITTRHDTARDLVVAEVSDNGNGVDPADYQKLFQPYFSTKGRGTGLGLAIVNRIVVDHHGRIKAVSNQPKGARFIVELPMIA